MRILVVEDDSDFLPAVLDVVRRANPHAEVITCSSRDSALSAIRASWFDYAILDLKIPAADGDIDAESAHGKAVYEALRNSSPGTPICFLTAFGTDDFISDRLVEARPSDVWGAGKQEPMIRMLKKGRIVELEPLLRAVSDMVLECDQVELNNNPGLGENEKRVIRIFARRNQGRSINVRQLTGGLSGARVLKTEVRDRYGAVRLTCAARVTNRNEVLDEVNRYKRDIVRLPNGYYSTHCDSVMEGAGDFAGVFYTLIPNFQSLLGVLRKSETDAITVIQRAADLHRKWTDGHPQSSVAIRSIRQGLVSDESLLGNSASLDGLDWRNFEETPVQVHLTAQHGDLHCENVLVDENFQPILIDFGRVGDAPSCLDPLTLELAFLFHPSCKNAVGDWPSPEAARNWTDIEQYTSACPFKEFIKAVRLWAVANSGGNRALYATAYAFAVRQLKFSGTDKNLARAIVEGALTAARNT